MLFLARVKLKLEYEKEKACPQCLADTLFGFNNQIVLVASTRTCREVQPERVILFECPVTLLVDVQSVCHFFFVIGKSI